MKERNLAAFFKPALAIVAIALVLLLLAPGLIQAAGAAPRVDMIYMNYWFNDQVYAGWIFGAGFQRNGAAKLSGVVNGERHERIAHYYQFNGEGFLVVMFDLRCMPAGQYDVMVTNPDGRSGVLRNGFTIKNPPRIDFVYENHGHSGQRYFGWVFGANFEQGSTVYLTEDANPANHIMANHNQYNGSGFLVVGFDLTRVPAKNYTLRISPPGGGSMASRPFRVL